MVHRLARNSNSHLVGLFDPHFPYENVRAVRAVYQYIAETKPDIVVWGGDVTDLDMLHNAASRRDVEGKRLIRDFNYTYNQLKLVRELVPNADIYILEGNHDEREERYIDDHPEVEGILEVPKMLRLDELQMKWVPSWRKGEILRIGKANFIHGQYTNKNHACTTVDNYGCNMFYGHGHDIQSFSKIIHGDDSTLIAQSCGCLCRYDQPYIKGAPTRWQLGFLDMYIRPDGYFNHQVVSIFKNKFMVGGVTYGN